MAAGLMVKLHACWDSVTVQNQNCDWRNTKNCSFYFFNPFLFLGTS
uniref:Uncharacterized protein n=1 Tax=Nelumbo nucifera TaxID=4432 RepID=A0A822XRG4_NELNU|nr:TPA_asm: hypothetical protein HUJ06_023716 [Nelumbo nucifera]DAD22266.1 TPA_asm: hypothetical protein HUJ06_023729 [Nelumbo nucifera]